MIHLRQLRKLFRVQLRARGLLAAGTTILLIFGFGLITADFHAWWFTALPWLRSASSWVKAQDSWDLFIFVFLGVNLIGYLQQIQGTLLDRHNLRILVRLSEQEIDDIDGSPHGVAKPSSLLSARRRALESLFRSDPGVYSLVALVVALLILGHPLAATVLVAFGTFLMLYFRRMVATFTSLNEPQEGDDMEPLDGNGPELVDRDGAMTLPSVNESPETSAESLTPSELWAKRQAWRASRAAAKTEQEAERRRRVRARAEARLSTSAERMFVIVNRPIVRLKIGWPILVAAAAAVAGVATLTIHDMSTAGELPERGTLLILLLVLASRACMTLAQHWEDLSFFTASLVLVDRSDTGQESL